MAARKLIDIGANLTDSMFSGVYNGNTKHPPDLEYVLNRSWTNGLDKIIITGTNLADSKQGIELSKTNPQLYCTVGCHPTRCTEFTESEEVYLNSLSELIKEGGEKVVAVGECGLDYDRLQFCEKSTQLKYFEKQLTLAKRFRLPLFLHCRNSADDLISILTEHKDLNGGVVHSFDGTIEEAKQFINLGYYIGLNGCSLKTQANLDTVKQIPSDRILIETDCPWCEIRPSHAGYKYIKTFLPSVKKEKWSSENLVKSRNEPSNIVQVLEVLSQVKGENEDKLMSSIYDNTIKVFFPNLR